MSSRDRSSGALLATLFLAALALRPQIIGLGPLLPRIQQDLSISYAVAGSLGTIPVLCMGLFAPVTPPLVARWGSERLITVVLAAIGAFGLARAFAPEAATLMAWTVGVGIAVAVGQSVLPVMVKQHFPERPAMATGVYASGIQLGAATSAWVAAPLASTAGGWRGALAVFSAATFVLAGVWITSTTGGRQAPAGGRLPRLPLRSGVAWLITGIFALQSAPYYGLNAWLPAFLLEGGWSEADAGTALALLNITGLVGTLVVPRLADRRGSRRAYLTIASLVLGSAILAMQLAPGSTWVAAPIAGACLGTLFALSLTLPLDVADRPRDVGAVAGLMLGVGYGLSAFTPTVLGGVRDALGGFAAALWILLAIVGLLVLACLALSPTLLASRSGDRR